MLALAILLYAQLAHGTVPTPADFNGAVLVTLRESSAPGFDCGVPWAVACAREVGEGCEVLVPNTGGMAWAVAASALTPDQIWGHELAHCFVGPFHV